MEIVSAGVDKASPNAFSWSPQLFYLQTYSRQPFVFALDWPSIFEGKDALRPVHITDNKVVTGHGFRWE
jgi:hypothetical protein